MNPNSLVIGDTHLGARSGSQFMREFIGKYLIEKVIKYCSDNGIKTIIQTGDFYDVRSSLYARDYDFLKKQLIPALQEHDITLYTFPGNHDIALADSVDISWTQLFEDMSDGSIINFEKPGDYKIGGELFCIIPWVCKDNYDQVLKAIEDSKAQVCIGHFELAGFEMYNGVVAEKGTLPNEIFEKFTQVLSGHYHTRSQYGCIRFIGAPYHLTWMDYPDGTNRGFEVISFDDQHNPAFEFVPNEESDSVFRVFEYSQDKDPNFKKYSDPEYLDNVLGFKGQIVRVQVTDREQSKNQFKLFCGALKKCKAIDYLVVDKTELITTSEIVVDEAVLQMDVLQILNEKVEKATGIDTNAVKLKLAEINREAQNRELI